MAVEQIIWIAYKPIFSIGYFFTKLNKLTLRFLDSSERGKEYVDFRFWKEMSFLFPHMPEGSPNGAPIHKAGWSLCKFFERCSMPFEDASYRLLSKIDDKWDDIPLGKRKQKYDFELSYRESRDADAYLTRREHRQVWTEIYEDDDCDLEEDYDLSELVDLDYDSVEEDELEEGALVIEEDDLEE
jgi:hypothetical protein